MSHRAKLKRAKTHLLAFEAGMKVFVNSEPYSDVTKGYLKTPGEILVEYDLVGQGELPREMALILGDALFNMRASLDHLAFALARKNAGATVRESGISFPIYTDQAEFTSKRVRAIGQMSPAVQGIIERMQPYKERPDAPQSHPLTLLNALNNHDKHRYLTATVLSTRAAPRISDRSVDVHPVPLRGVQYSTPDDKTNRVEFVLQTTGPNPHVEMDSDLTIEIAFPQAGPAAGKFVIPKTEDIFVHIRDVVFPALECFL